MAIHELIPFRWEHLARIDPGRDQGDWVERMRKYDGDPHSWTGLRDGVPFICGGLARVWSGRWIGWVSFDCRVGVPAMRWITRTALIYLDRLQRHEEFRRVEMTVVDGFPSGAKWARMLGFKQEGFARCYDEFGHDHLLYSRIR